VKNVSTDVHVAGSEMVRGKPKPGGTLSVSRRFMLVSVETSAVAAAGKDTAHRAGDRRRSVVSRSGDLSRQPRALAATLTYGRPPAPAQ